MLNEHLFFPAFHIALEESDEGGSGGGSASQSTDEGGGDAIMPDADAEALRGEISKLRSEAAKYRTRSKDYDDVKSRLEKLEGGLKSVLGEDEDPDPEKLKQKTESLENQLRSERVKSAVTMQAISAGLDPDMTIAYLQHQGKLSEVDVSDTDKIAEIVSKVADDKPALKLKQPDAVGTGNNGNDGSDNDKPLNPIEAFRQKKGIVNNSK